MKIYGYDENKAKSSVKVIFDGRKVKEILARVSTKLDITLDYLEQALRQEIDYIPPKPTASHRQARINAIQTAMRLKRFDKTSGAIDLDSLFNEVANQELSTPIENKPVDNLPMKPEGGVGVSPMTPSIRDEKSKIEDNGYKRFDIKELKRITEPLSAEMAGIPELN